MLKAPTTGVSPTFAAVADALGRAGASTEAAEAHGSLCGLLCGLGRAGQATWLADVLGDAQAGAGPKEEAGDLLDSLAASTSVCLEEGSLEFQPLLPDDETPLAGRVDSLAQWCQGFNHGLFVAARVGDAEAEMGSGHTAEIVRDFSEMAQVAVGDDEADAEGEAAYAELVEFIRVSVQLVYEELTGVRQRVQSAGLH